LGSKATKEKAVVLVHGGFVDGSGWEGVYQKLEKDGYDVSIVQNPTVSLAGDVAATRSVIDAQHKPVILVGHTPMAELLSPKRVTTRTLSGLCTSPPLRQIKASP
jgi:hypothetical protein